MGRKSGVETLVALVNAFQKRRSWSQAELAPHVGVTVPVVRKRLNELSTAGFPLERFEDAPHVYWSLPKDWVPGGISIAAADVPDLMRQLLRLPRAAGRDRLLAKLVAAVPAKGAPVLATEALVTSTRDDSEESHLAVVEDAAARRVAARIRYFSSQRDATEWRHVSVHRIVIGPPARIAAFCHRAGELRWFRIDAIRGAALDAEVAFRGAPPAAVEAFLRESVDGFHGADAPRRCVFFVREPDARWVAQNLLDAMRAEAVDGGIRVTVETAGLARVARFVVGLGGAAVPETPELAARVLELAGAATDNARAALEASGGQSRSS